MIMMLIFPQGLWTSPLIKDPLCTPSFPCYHTCWHITQVNALLSSIITTVHVLATCVTRHALFLFFLQALDVYWSCSGASIYDCTRKRFCKLHDRIVFHTFFTMKVNSGCQGYLIMRMRDIQYCQRAGKTGWRARIETDFTIWASTLLHSSWAK